MIQKRRRSATRLAQNIDWQNMYMCTYLTEISNGARNCPALGRIREESRATHSDHAAGSVKVPSLRTGSLGHPRWKIMSTPKSLKDQIRQLKADGFSQREIARLTGTARNTVAKILKENADEGPRGIGQSDP